MPMPVLPELNDIASIEAAIAIASTRDEISRIVARVDHQLLIQQIVMGADGWPRVSAAVARRCRELDMQGQSGARFARAPRSALVAELVDDRWEGDAAHALTNRAARRIEELEDAIRQSLGELMRTARRPAIGTLVAADDVAARLAAGAVVRLAAALGNDRA